MQQRRTDYQLKNVPQSILEENFWVPHPKNLGREKLKSRLGLIQSAVGSRWHWQVSVSSLLTSQPSSGLDCWHTCTHRQNEKCPWHHKVCSLRPPTLACARNAQKLVYRWSLGGRQVTRTRCPLHVSQLWPAPASQSCTHPAGQWEN